MSSTHDRGSLGSRFAHHTRHLRRRPRLAIAAALGILAYLVLPAGIDESTRLLAAFDIAATAFLAAVWIMMARASTAAMRRRARIEDEGRHVVLALTINIIDGLI